MSRIPSRGVPHRRHSQSGQRIRRPVVKAGSHAGRRPTLRASARGDTARGTAEEALIDDDPLLNASDATLAARAVDGDVQAFEQLARRHGALMRVYAAKLLGSEAESEDVVQEAFLTGWRRLADLDSPAHIRNWLMRIVTHKAIDRIRVRRRHDDIDDWDPPAPPEHSPERIVEARLQLDAVWEALDRLPADQRRCWLLRETAGYSYQEIADALELPVSTVRGLLARARRFLLHELEAWR
ncbi:RNA polymerase subunit sigma-70 [Rathayibacter sp. AY1E8]|jgi:RNA polymerase sigma-70 factor (ECF subfamily)|nr:RNA polymerase subunit sigma-70 [Rathayibacter sp. AY1E8]PPG84573.1 RNA polymerase subunit sigma-70 [Rathayibacter sp. AY1H2]